MACLRDKVVVITGASSGIGKAAAIRFAEKGSKVVLAARRIEQLEELKKEILKNNKNCLCVKTDVSSEKDVKYLFDSAERRFGKVDILINNAGRGLKSGLCDISYDEWMSVINTNLTGVFLCTREAVRRMVKKKVHGHIITVSSIAGLYGAPTYAAYCASKHGVTGFKRSLRFELFKNGIRVSTIHPARVDTEFFNTYSKKPHKSQMLSPFDIADYLVAIATRNIIKIMLVRMLLVFKRAYYPLKHLVK